MAELEWHSSAWNRAYNYRKLGKSSWQGEKTCPIRLRGYTELIMGGLPEKLRKKIDSALKRGYALEDSTRLPHVLSLIRDHCPVGNVPIGYFGKTYMDIYVPTEEAARDLRAEIRGMNVMTEAFSKNTIRSISKSPWYEYWQLLGRAGARKGSDPASRTSHLVSCFKELRPLIDECMEKDAAKRELIARWCADDASTIRVPFDSHKEEDDEE